MDKENLYLIPGILLGTGVIADVVFYALLFVTWGLIGMAVFYAILITCFVSWKLYYRWVQKQPSLKQR